MVIVGKEGGKKETGGDMKTISGSSCDDYKTSLERAYAVLEPLL